MSVLQEPYLTREEVAGLLRIDPQTVSRWVRERRLPPPLRLGRQMLWNCRLLERFLTEKAGPAPT